MKRLISLLSAIAATSTFALAGTYAVYSTSAAITSSSGDNWYYTDYTSQIDSRTVQCAADMSRPIGPFESMSGGAYGFETVNYYTITAVIRYYPDENEVVDEEEIRQVFWAGRWQSKTTTYTGNVGDYAYAWESEYATDTEASGANDYDEKGTLSGGSVVWYYDLLPIYGLFNLHPIGGGVYEGTSTITFGLPNSPAHQFTWILDWTPFDSSEMHMLVATGLWRRQWRVISVEGQSFSGY